MKEDRQLFTLDLDKKMTIIAKLSFIAIVLMVLGIMISVGIRGFGPRDEEGYSYQLEDWAKKTVHVGALIYYSGVGILSMCLLGLAFFTKRMHLYLRIGLIVSTALLLGPALNASYYLLV